MRKCCKEECKNDSNDSKWWKGWKEKWVVHWPVTWLYMISMIGILTHCVTSVTRFHIADHSRGLAWEKIARYGQHRAPASPLMWPIGLPKFYLLSAMWSYSGQAMLQCHSSICSAMCWKCKQVLNPLTMCPRRWWCHLNQTLLWQDFPALTCPCWMESPHLLMQSRHMAVARAAKF